MTNYKLVIFDWDGTLMDSVSRIVSSVQAAANSLNIEPPTNDEGKSIIGLSLDEAVEQLFPHVSEKIKRQLAEQYSHQYLHVNEIPAPLFENVLSLLKRLKEHNVLIAVATGKNRQGLNRVIEATQTQRYFDATRTATECKSKPNPEMITSLLTQLNIKPSEAVMIGDTSFDMEMALNANVDRVGVSFGAHTVDVIKSYQPKVIVNSYSELAAFLFQE